MKIPDIKKKSRKEFDEEFMYLDKQLKAFCSKHVRVISGFSTEVTQITGLYANVSIIFDGLALEKYYE